MSQAQSGYQLSALRGLGTPLCPAGHLPHKEGDRQAASASQTKGRFPCGSRIKGRCRQHWLDAFARMAFPQEKHSKDQTHAHSSSHHRPSHCCRRAFRLPDADAGGAAGGG
ncbi:hypothetical protein ELH73_03565 [Rhizobium leguminosarum]|nr:hypothetical protein ELI28_03560 [Rhizobium leguminosarum]TAV77250.1 hypothetical protein ELI27_03560 [Rhizobium leguminosarum]TAZ28997.1 hypothetical protein ELH73_03565 [Rhizobium leguminosarum]